jgi:hypothetical protein
VISMSDNIDDCMWRFLHYNGINSMVAVYCLTERSIVQHNSGAVEQII